NSAGRRPRRSQALMPDTVPRSRAIMWLRASLGALVAVGIRPGVDESLAKRIRLTNGLSLFGVVLLGGVAYVCFPLLNGFGFLTGSRLLCLLVSNLIVLGNDVLLGHDSGAELVFVALAAVPFAVFDLQEWGALLAGIVFALAGFAVGHTRVLRRVYAPPE